MSTNPPYSILFSPAIRSLIPLFYAAWSDQVLPPSKINALRKRAEELPGIDEDDRRLIRLWSDPQSPPSRELFKLWEVEMLRCKADLPKGSKASLVDLGLAMARGTSGTEKSHADAWQAPETRSKLEAIEEMLGAIGLDTYRRLFPETVASYEWEAHRGRFHPATLQSQLDGPYGDTRRRVEQLLQRPDFQQARPAAKEDYRQLVLEWTRHLAQNGMGALGYPEHSGGHNDMGAYGTVFETLAYFDLSLTVKFGVQFGLFGGSIHGLGTEDHHRKYLPKAGSLEFPGGFAMTETGHGSNVRGLETTITYEADQQAFSIHTPRYEAGKEYIGNALHGRMVTVFGQLISRGENHGIHAILVPIRDKSHRLLAGIRIEDNGYKMGLNGVDNGRIWFDQVRVPRENLLNRFGGVAADGTYHSPITNPSKRFFTMLGTLVGGRVFVARAGLSAAKKGLAIAIRYALRRRQFAAPGGTAERLLLDYPSHQRRLLPLLAKAYALHFALGRLMERYLHRTEADSREVETLAAGLKAYATWFTTNSLQECREACGGKGYLQENELPALRTDTDIFTTFEGDNTVLMQLVARSRLTRFKQEFSEEGVMGVLRFLGNNIATDIRERNPIIIRNTDRDHLLDPDFHHSALLFRENRLLYTVSQRMRSLIKADYSAYAAFLECQTHLLQLAEAFVERFVLERFREGLTKIETEAEHQAMERVYQLFALHTLESRKGWFLEKGYMEGNKTKAIHRLVDELCGEVRQDAYALGQAFGIPEQLLRAEIL